MTVQILSARNYKIMPWKNGKGHTTQIGIFPQESSLENFHWRLSMADVKEDGAFSEFKKCHRYLTLLEGPCLELSFVDRKERVTQKNVLHFSGEEATYGTLPQGPVKDLNFIYRQDLADVQFVLSEGSILEASFESETALLFVHKGQVRISPDIAIGPFQCAHMIFHEENSVLNFIVEDDTLFSLIRYKEK